MSITRPAKPRDPRLDFFRGISLFIILVSHTRGDWLADWIPARFGLSDAADMFVFVSGYAGGLAFFGVYRRHGWWMGTVRVWFRVWQLYVAQLAIVVAVAALAVALDRAWPAVGDQDSYITLMGLDWLFADPKAALFGVATLTYVPHYLDILPVYMLVLGAVPLAVLIARVRPALVVVVSVALWFLTWMTGWNLPTEPSEPRGWFLDPFAWQMLFFTGFSLSAGWLKPPPVNRSVLAAAVAVLVVGLVLTRPEIFLAVPVLAEAEAWLLLHTDKTLLDPFQVVHFYASAYVAVRLLRGRLHLIQGERVRPVVRCGQQALSVFLTGIILAHLGSAVFDQYGTGVMVQLVWNGLGIVVSLGIAWAAEWLKAKPWTAIARATPVPRSEGVILHGHERTQGGT